jgi:hypothetical protein
MRVGIGTDAFDQHDAAPGGCQSQSETGTDHATADYGDVELFHLSLVGAT